MTARGTTLLREPLITTSHNIVLCFADASWPTHYRQTGQSRWAINCQKHIYMPGSYQTDSPRLRDTGRSRSCLHTVSYAPTQLRQLQLPSDLQRHALRGSLPASGLSLSAGACAYSSCSSLLIS